MHPSRVLPAVLIHLVCFVAIAQEESPPSWLLGMPEMECVDCQYIKNKRFVLLHDSNTQGPRWVAYLLRPQSTTGSIVLTEDFREDPNARGDRGERSDYAGVSYERVQFCPPGDSTSSKEELSSTYLLSNVAPQTCLLHQGEWNALENAVRLWTHQRGELLVVCGPVFDASTARIEIGDGVDVPDQFFKIIVDYREDRNCLEAIAFLLPNSEKSVPKWQETACAVDKIESLVGADFFPAWQDQTFEAACDLGSWLHSSSPAPSTPVPAVSNGNLIGGSPHAATGPSGATGAPIQSMQTSGDITVYVTRTGKKYHRGDCRWLSRSKIPMKLSEARLRYAPCSTCNPPP